MSLKLKTRPLFPAHVEAESPILLEKEGVVYTFSFDVDALSVSLGLLYQPIDATLTALAALNSTAGLLTQTGADAFTKTVPGTGVLTALGVNIGSAGAPVLFNGALGAPSSGTLTSCTGLPISTGLIGTGTGVLTALAVNVGSAGALVTFNGALGNPSSGTLTNCTIPVTQITGFGTGGATFLGTPSSANLRSFLTDETGTGAAVFATSPTITTPNVVGTTAADSAAAGSLGEYMESVIAVGSATALTTATAKTVTSITLTAGDWDVEGIVNFLTGASTSVTVTISGLSTTTNTLDTTAGRFSIHTYTAVVPGNLTGLSETLPSYRFNVSGSTTIFLIAQSTFTVSTNSAWGLIRARRVR